MTTESIPAVICTVDVVLLTLEQATLKVALVRREREPFAQALALPGGYIHAQDDVDAQASAVRVLRDKAGLEGPYLEQLATFTGAVRDPRGWSVAVAYCALVPATVLAQAAGRVELVAVDALPPLPFDHRQIIDTAVLRVRSKSQYSSLPVHLCAEPFTLPHLQAAYEVLQPCLVEHRDQGAAHRPDVLRGAGGGHFDSHGGRLAGSGRSRCGAPRRAMRPDV